MLQNSTLNLFQGLSHFYAGGTLDDPEDIFQDMVLACLEQGAKNPEFYNQKPAYIAQRGRLTAKDAVRNCQRFYRYAFWAQDDENGESALDYIASDDLTPEQALEHKEQLEAIVKVFGTLSGREQAVVKLAIKGRSTGEIAKRLGVSPAAVSIYKNRAMSKIHKALLEVF